MIVSAVTAAGSTRMEGGLVTPNGRSSSFNDRAQTARCRGVGIAIKGRFAAFKCDVRWVDSRDINRAVLETVAWFRPLPWRASSRWTPMTLVCSSTRTLADCPPAIPASPLPGDPRTCPRADCSPEQSAGNLAATARAAVLLKARAASPRRIFVNFGCVARTAFSYRCNSGVAPSRQTVATVSFVRGSKSWATVIALSP